jgi:C-terminal processing protease CtpA/Prc
MLQPEDAKSDIRQWLSFIEKTHPDLAYTTKNIDDFHNRVNEFKNSIKEPISVRDFWLEMMKFNSVISDGHVSLTPSKSRELTKDYLKSGGSLFPFKVIFDNNQLVIKEKLNGEPSNIAGNTITRINGISINTILKPLLERTHGDSENQRRAVLATRFSSYYWLFFGENKQFQLDIKVGTHTINNITVEASNGITYYAESFESNFKFDVLNKDTGLLTINTFTWRQNESRVFEFLKSVFTRVKENNLTHLMIDIRENGGGDDNIWKQGILPYIADKAWKHGSDYKVKILAGREDEGETAGDVVSGVLTNMTAADINNPLKFTGDVSVLVGPYTYSSSILFMNVIQDYEFGKLVGDKTGGKSGQTGGTQHLTLTHSNLHSVVPRFLLTRPKGGRNLELVTLDTIIKYDPMKPTQLIEKLLIN